jgi:hypothetical protein
VRVHGAAKPNERSMIFRPSIANVLNRLGPGTNTEMARVQYEYRIERGEPDEKLCAVLTELSATGWDVAGITYGTGGLICVLRREKDFEVARSLQAALEHEEPINAVSHQELPSDGLDQSSASSGSEGVT